METGEQEEQLQDNLSKLRRDTELEMILPEGGASDTKSNQLNFLGGAIHLHLLLEKDLKDYPCNFWVGLSRPGTFEPFKEESSFEMQPFFDKVALEGLTGKGPFLYCEKEKSFYLLPSPDLLRVYPETWLKNLYAQAAQVDHQTVGFYFAQHVLAFEKSLGFLEKIIKELISFSSFSSLYILVDASEKVKLLSKLIDFSFRLREEKLNLHVYH